MSVYVELQVSCPQAYVHTYTGMSVPTYKHVRHQLSPTGFLDDLDRMMPKRGYPGQRQGPQQAGLPRDCRLALVMHLWDSPHRSAATGGVLPR